ncbi:MAG: hypothetical protein JNL67_01330 [Planctomycetaceae bacterium]|nr:hypothetical protein [Planctomycetaceae bacterium]
MRLAFLTNLTATESLPVLQRLGELSDCPVVHVYLYNTLAEAKTSPWKALREFGWRRLSSKLLSMMLSRVRTWLLKSPLKGIIQPRSAYEWVVARELPYSIVNNLNGLAEREHLAELRADLLVVCVCKNILRRKTIETPRLGTMNVHPSLLPEYRGPMPVLWMLYHGESMAGVTFQKMITEIDAGPVIAQFQYEIPPNVTESELSRSLFQLAASQLESVLREFKNRDGQLPISSRPGAGTYYSFPTAAERAALMMRQRH